MNRDQRWIAQYRLAPYLFLLPLVGLLAIYMVLPMAWSFVLSFQRTIGPRHSVFIGLENYRYLLRHDLLFGLAALNTAGFTIAFVLLQVPLSLGLALLLNRRGIVGRNVFRFCFFSTYLVGPVFVAVIFYQLFAPEGLVNHLASIVLGRMVSIGWLSTPSLVMPVILIASLWLTVGVGMVYFLAALQGVNPDLYEAAAIDGAGPVRSFFNVTLPGIRPVLAYVVLVGTIGGFQLFELPYILLQGPGPDGRGLTIVMYLFSMGFGAGDLGYASAIGWVLVLILFLVSFAQVKFLRWDVRN